MRGKNIVLVILLITISCALFAAGQKETADEAIEISFLNFFVRGTDAVAAGADPRITQFKEDFPDIVLQEESLGFSDALTKLKSLGAADNLPDIFIPNIPMAKEWAEAGLLHPIDEFLDDDPSWKNGFLPGSLNEFKFDGTTYGVPPWKNIHGIVFYNEVIFSECGLSAFPETWDEFVAAVKTIKAHGYLPWTAYGKQAFGFSSVLSILNYGQFGSGWFEGVLAGENKFTDTQFLQSLARYKELQDAGAFNEDMYSMDQTQARSAYLNGDAAMSVDGTWAVGLISANASEDVLKNTKLAFIPGGTGKVTVPAGGGWGLCVNAKITDPKKLDAIGTFIKYISDSTFGESLLYAGVYPSSMPEEYDTGKLTALGSQYMEVLPSVDSGLFWDLALSAVVIDKIETEVELFLLGKAEADEVAAAVQKAFEEDL